MFKDFIVNFKQISHVVPMLLPWLLCTEFEQAGSITVEIAEQCMLFHIDSISDTFNTTKF